MICFENDFCDHKWLYILLSVMILIPVCWLKSMSFLAYFSAASNMSLLFSCKSTKFADSLLVFIIVYYAMLNRAENPEQSENLNYFKPSALPLFFGVAVFDFEGNNIVLNLHAAMKEPTKIFSVMKYVLGIYVFMIATFSAFCYIGYGSVLSDMVTLNLPHDNLTSTLQIFYCFGLLGSYPIQMLPVFQIVEVAPRFKKLKAGKHKLIIWRTVCVLMTAITAMSVPKFGLFINLIGSVACTILAFIVPVLCYNKAFEGEMSRKKENLHTMLCIIGAIGGILSFYVSCQNLILAFTEDEERSHGMHTTRDKM